MLNTTKTKELIIDFREDSADSLLLLINGDCVETVHNFTFLGTHISDNLSGSANTTAVVKKAQQRLHFLRALRKNRLNERLLLSLLNKDYSVSLEDIANTYYLSRATNIIQDCSHLGHHLFDPLPSGRSYTENTDHKIHEQFLSKGHLHSKLYQKLINSACNMKTVLVPQFIIYSHKVQ